ncbi:MAG: formate/nitrite transporter family protein [Caldimonas sp.]
MNAERRKREAKKETPPSRAKAAAGPAAGADTAEEVEAEERSSPSGRIVYKAILREGEEELLRPSSALFWSGIAAGLSMGFSMFGQGLLMAHLPDAPWRPLVASFGYCFGFLVVVLGRQQLFTENTLTPILPLLQKPGWKTLANVARLWLVVLVANLIGALVVALISAHTSGFEPEAQKAFVAIGRADVEVPFATTMLRGIAAGWLIALMVWLMPFAESGRIWVIIFITYLVGLGKFSHIIAGSLAVFTWAATEGGWWRAIAGFAVPCLIGNVIGGVLLVAALNHAQVVAGSPDEEL